MSPGPWNLQLGVSMRCFCCTLLLLTAAVPSPALSDPKPQEPSVAGRVEALLARMTLEEKIGQLNFPSHAFPRDEQLAQVRELEGFEMVSLAAGEARTVRFRLAAADLAYHDDAGRAIVEPGRYRVFVGGSSTAELSATFEITGP